jgi:hypothetical protein
MVSIQQKGKNTLAVINLSHFHIDATLCDTWEYLN